MRVSKALAKLAVAALVVGVLIAVSVAPLAGISSVAIARTNATMASDVDELEAGNAPGVTTIKDARGDDMAYLFNQRRHPVTGDRISQSMKDAIVSIEDRRFYEHNGVDIPGNLRAIVTNLAAGGVSQGASTLDQQYVKNYLLLVTATDDEQRAQATEQSVARKLREMRIAVEMDKNLSKDEILTNYLNLVPFGNHAFGIEAAAQTYFGKPASDLSLGESALMAGMVQSSESLNPYTNPQGATDRRNAVLQSMVDNGYVSQPEADDAAAKGLGILDKPALLANGCIGAGDRGFFCDYVLEYLSKKGLDTEELARGGYTINTTLDPEVQDQTKAAVDSQTNPATPGVAEVMNVIKPDKNDRDVLAMVSSRTYGLNLDNNETMLPQPYSMVGNGAGSVFKVFTAAAALQSGYGIKNTVEVPRRYEADGLGHGGADNCPETKYCVENAGTYKTTMSMEEALAQSPNTAFIKLEEEVGIQPVVDMSVKLGLRSYTEAGTYGDTDLASFAKQAPMGSYTLGPTAVNPLELSNVGASIAAGGRWCEPNPVDKVTDKNGNEVFIETPPCEDVLDERAANALSNAMTLDAQHGTAQAAARAAGFANKVAAKTGTTESNQSAAFLGFNSNVSAAPYIYNDGTSTSPLCSNPARQCGAGTMYGGEEAARSFFFMANNVTTASQGTIPDYDRAYDNGTSGDPILDGLRNKSESEARRTLESAGYTVTTRTVGKSGLAYGRVVRASPAGKLQKGAEVILQISDGTAAPAAPSTSAGQNQQRNGGGGNTGGTPTPAPAAPGGAPQPLISQNDIDNLTNQLRNAFGL